MKNYDITIRPAPGVPDRYIVEQRVMEWPNAITLAEAYHVARSHVHVHGGGIILLDCPPSRGERWAGPRSWWDVFRGGLWVIARTVRGR